MHGVRGNMTLRQICIAINKYIGYGKHCATELGVNKGSSLAFTNSEMCTSEAKKKPLVLRRQFGAERVGYVIH